jgi:asparagine synthase (glutamine-hydrolysing)
LSGIVGFLGLDSRPATPEDLQRMVTTLAHRGPDRQAIWNEGYAGLGHCMLYTTPESLTEQLPFKHNGLVITADSRIDNRNELIANLGLAQDLAQEITDSELILASYQRWGERCPERLLGDFAFAIWDTSERRLFCARDYLGVRPFYYYYLPGRLFVFASEIKALLCLQGVSCHHNEQRIGDYLAIIPGDKTITFYQDIYRLLPAHSLSVDVLGCRFRKYWSLDFDDQLRLASSQEYAECYRDVFTKAVECRLRSAFALGSALSGGLDSSSIVSVARESLRRQNAKLLKTFSGIFDEVRASDERHYIYAVVEQGGIEPHYVHVDQISPLVELQKVLWLQEEPIWTPNLYMHWGLFSSAKKQGVRIFLDGFLGDNIVGHGWEYLKDLAYDWRWLRLLRELRGVVKRRPGFVLRDMVLSYLWHGSVLPHCSRTIGRFWSKPSHSMEVNPLLNSIIHPDFSKRINIAERRQDMEAESLSPPDAARKQQYHGVMSGEIPLGLEIANKTAAGFNLEDRYPFVDRRVVEFCMAVPPDQKIQDGRSRMIVRRAFSNLLPSRVCWRTGKADLSHNLRFGLLKFEEELLDNVLLRNTTELSAYCDTSILGNIYKDYKKQRDTEYFQAIWVAVNLAVWLSYAK